MSERDSRVVVHWGGGRLHLLRSESRCRKACPFVGLGGGSGRLCGAVGSRLIVAMLRP